MPTVISDARGPFGRNVPLAAAIRRAIRDAGCATPVVTARRHRRPSSRPRRSSARGDGGLASAAARQTLADPDWFRKIRLGYGDPDAALRVHELLREESTSATSRSRAKLWDRAFDPADPAVRLASDGRRRLSAPPWSPPDEG